MMMQWDLAAADLQSRVEVPVQPLHDEQHSDAGALRVRVIDHRAVKVDEALMFGQSPAVGGTIGGYRL